MEHLDEIVAVIRGVATAMGLLWPVAVYLATLTANLLGIAETSTLIGLGSFVFTGYGALVALGFLILMSVALALSARHDAIVTRRHELRVENLNQERELCRLRYREKEQEMEKLRQCEMLLNILREIKQKGEPIGEVNRQVSHSGVPYSPADLIVQHTNIHSSSSSVVNASLPLSPSTMSPALNTGS